jgi:hypothetical protein
MALKFSPRPGRRARFLCVAVAGLAGVLLAPPPSRAQDTKQAWQPKAPEGLPTDFDWIRLPSDEWLKGKIVSMYDGKLEFDSDELGVHTFDFGDIKEIRTSRVVQVGLADKKPVTGRLVLADKAARVVAETGETAFDRSEILTIVVGARREIDYWSGYANLGGTIRSGNSDQIDYTGRLGTVRRSVRDRTGIDYIGNITRIDDADTSNNHRVTLGWDRYQPPNPSPPPSDAHFASCPASDPTATGCRIVQASTTTAISSQGRARSRRRATLPTTRTKAPR